jgi:cobaltochelatase CobT
MSAQAAIDLIDTYGTKLKRWPASARATYDAARTDKKVRDHYTKAKKVDDRLRKWKSSEDGAKVEDENGSEEGPSEAGKPKGEMGSSGEKTGEVKKAPPASGETLGEIANALAGMMDMDGALIEAITKMVKVEFKGQRYVEFTREYDRIEKVKAPVGTDISEMETAVQKVSAVMAKDLQRIITARSLTTMQPGLRRGRINPSALHRLEVNDDRVFRKKIENKSNDVAVSLLIDCSGSMNGLKFQLAMESAWAFAEVLDRLNIKCEVLGFTTHTDSVAARSRDFIQKAQEFAKLLGRSIQSVRVEPIYMPIAKEFGERFGIEQKRRLAFMRNGGVRLQQNIDGACVMEAARRLMGQPAKRKLLMVFSDGNPASAMMDYGVLQKHLKDVVKEVEKMGIETIGVGIADESVEEFYPKHFVVYSLNELPQKVIGELKKFLTR